MASEQYYRPYLPSDSELSDADESYSATSSPPPEPREGSDASTPTGVSPSSSRAQSQLPDFSALAAGLLAPVNLEPPAGQSFVTDIQQLAYGINRPDKRAPYSYYNADASGQNLAVGRVSQTSVTSLVMLQSKDRYKKIFPQPTNCHLFLPRRHKNITGISITQLNLTSSFFYFRENKFNLQIQIQENGRVVYLADSTKTPTNTSNALILNNSIREGSYNITELLAELSTQLNKTPLFYDYLNGFSDFVSAFSVTGDFSVNFNEPGDNYYDSAKKIFIQNPTREIICEYYFQSRYSVSTDFTEANLRCAYYYPVLKEILLDTTDTTKDSLILVYPGYTRDHLIEYLIYEFQGISDTIADSVIVANISTKNNPLDTYRLLHTFRYSLVNSYTCTYNPTNLRVTIYSESLNTSLKKMLIAQYNSYLGQQLNLNGITLDYYNSLSAKITSDLAIIQEMYDFMQSYFANYFAIGFGTFHRSYYTHSNYTLQLRPGLYASDIQKVYAGTNPKARLNDIMTDFKDTPLSYWPYMANLGNVVSQLGYNMGLPDTAYPISWNHPYMLAYSNMDIANNFINSNGEIYTDYRRKAGDILVNVEAGKYTIFKFKSKVRQSLQVESLPRQTAYRYPAWNKNNPVPYPVNTIFDISYCFIDARKIPALSNYVISDISYNAVYGWSTMTNDGKDNMWNYSTNYSATYTNSAAFWGTKLEQLNTTNPEGRVYRFIAPYPVASNLSGSNVYTYDYNITISAFTPTLSTPVPTNFKEDFYAFFYHDESALAADRSAAGTRKESPYFYKSALTLATNTSNNTYTFKAYAGQTYFMLLRPSTISPPATYYTVVPWTANTCNILSYATNFTPTADPMTMLGNFHVAKNADPAFIRMPVSTIYTGRDDTPQYDSNSSSNTVIQKYNKPLQIINTPIGYDTNGISTDMTDYIPYEPYGNLSNIDPITKTRIDPLTDYVFSYNTPYSDISQNYFPEGGENFIKTVNAANIYTSPTNGVSERQYKIAQYYGTTYLKNDGSISYASSDISPYIPPYTKATTNGPLGGSYTYNAANELNLGSGVCGFTFLPADGIWNIERITIKSNFTNLTNSLNNDIHCIAVFFTSDIQSAATSYINLKNAIAICLRVKDRTYTSNTIPMGFDSALGTYHTFKNYPLQVVRKEVQISGYTQTGKQFISDVNSYYSALAIKFRNIGAWDTSAVNDTSIQNQIRVAIADPSLISVVNIQNLVGSPIPYPFAGTPSVSNAFYDGNKAPTDGNVVVSSPIPAGNKYGPPAGYDESVSKYEQSQEIVNSHIHYLSPLNIIADPNGFSAWDGLTVDLPDYIHASVYDPTSISSDTSGNSWYTGYAIIQGAAFSLVSYKIYDRISSTTNPTRTFTYKGQLSAQQIFPDGERTSIIAVTGNTSLFVFLGSTNVVPNNLLRLKTYNPANGFLLEYDIESSYTFKPTKETMQHFVYNNSNVWFYTVFVNDPDTQRTGIQLLGMYSNNLVKKFYEGYTMSELQMPPDGNNLYFAKYTDVEGGFSNIFVYPLANNQQTIDLSTYYTINLDTSPILDPSPYKYYKQFAVANNRGTEEVILTNTDYNSSMYYKIRSYLTTTTSNTSNTTIDFSKQTLSNVGIRRIMAGGQGSKWIILDKFPYIMGNRNDVMDSPTSLSLAWQIFFPTMKIEMRNVSANYTPITDRTNITYSEWPHVAMFAYSNFTSLSNDILKNGGKWGMESNFVTSDITFDGYDFNSYLLNFPLQSNANSLNSNDYYYLAVRGYLPTESFQTMLRFYLPKRYDFGFATFADMTKEVSILGSQKNSFNPLYHKALSSFNSEFVISKIFGSNSISGLSGSNITSTSFSNFLDQYNTLYTGFLSNSELQINIQSNLKNSITNFITSNLQYILPSYALTRQQFTSPITSRILWKDNLTTAYAGLDDEWGLGWNLGYAKENTTYSTAHTANSFFKIQQDFIYLRLNPELNINALDVGAKEDYESSREGSGITSRYYCKLLLTNFGGNATTFIHNPITFDPPIQNLTKLQFQWVDSTGAIIDNNDSEWSITVNIKESVPTQPSIKEIAAFQSADPKTGLPAGLPKEFQQPKAQVQGDYAAAKEAEALAAEKQAMYDAVDKRTMRAGKSQVKS